MTASPWHPRVRSKNTIPGLLYDAPVKTQNDEIFLVSGGFSSAPEIQFLSKKSLAYGILIID